MARYMDAIRWIANNDEPECTDVDVVAGMISVQLIADVWDKGTATVAADVVQVRAAGEPCS